MGKGVRLIDSAQQIVKEVARISQEEGLRKNNPRTNGRCRFYVTDDPDAFANQAVRFLGYRLSQVRKITNEIISDLKTKYLISP